MTQESQKATTFHVPVAVVIVLAVCAALLVMNGARPQTDGADRPARESDPKPSHAKPPRVDAGASSEQTDLPVDDPSALGQPDSPSHEAPLGDTQEPA